MATFRRLPSGLWQARVWHPGMRKYVPAGKPHPIKKRAREQAAEVEAKIRRGEWVDPKRGGIILAEWWETWCGMRSVEPATMSKDTSRWRNHIAPVFGTWTLNAMVDGSEDIATWVADMGRRGVGAETRRAALALLRQLLDAARRHKRISVNPAADIAVPSVPPHEDRILTRKEQHTLRMMFTRREMLIVETMLGTGLRWEELAGLRVGRVDVRRLTVKVYAVADRNGRLREYTKTRASYRVVPLPKRLARKLTRHMRGRGRGELVFTTRYGKALKYNHWRANYWAPAIARCKFGDPQPTIHDLRHTWCSEMANGGVPLSELQVISGHSRVTSLQRYLHGSEKGMTTARAVLDTWHGVGTPSLIPVQGGRESKASGQKKTRSHVRKREAG